MAEEKKADLVKSVRSIADPIMTAMQYGISFLIIGIIFFSLLKQYGIDIDSKFIPTVTKAADMAWYALVIALLTGKLSLGK